MTSLHSGDEVFAMAMAMEEAGKNFYESLSMGSKNKDVREFCKRTAKEEAGHYQLFAHMRKQWGQKGSTPPVPPQQEFELQTLVKNHVQPKSDVVMKVANSNNVHAALEMAIHMEQDAINFYQEMLVRIPHLAGALGPIVGEERKHLTGLKMLETTVQGS